MNDEAHTPNVLNLALLKSIESVHKGFLYQHLYAVGCMLLAQAAAIDAVMIELDEDIELATEQERIYVQVKTRSELIKPSDISGALARFAALRIEHTEGKRHGEAAFVIVANQQPSVRLQKTIDEQKIPTDVVFICPQSSTGYHPALPPAWESLDEAAAWCINKAKELPYLLLSPTSLIWKLAGLTQLAATGSALNDPHTFHIEDLPKLFEQIVVQLQNFPAPPETYRSQEQEPSFNSDGRVRIICGLSGAGKTAWAAEAALHYSGPCAYYDTGDLPGPALASALVRELAAKFAAADSDEMRKVLLPGATGIESLSTFDTFLSQQDINLLLVVDNAHRIPIDNLRDVLNATDCIRFVLLCQPNDNVRELEAITMLQREALLGWSIDTVAAEVADRGGYATAQGFNQLRDYTGGLPLYVQSVAKIAVTEYEGNVDALCDELQHQASSVDTAQEIILSRVYQGFEEVVQNSLALLSLADVGLNADEICKILCSSLHVSKTGAVAILKQVRATGAMETFGTQTLKVHDAVRALGLQHLDSMDHEVTNKALIALKELLVTSLQETHDTSRFALLTQVYIKLNDVMKLIDIAGEEIFYEMGITVDIFASLERASNSDSLDALNKFWALDGLAFSELRKGRSEKLAQHFEAMQTLISEHGFGDRETIAFAMKRILFSAENGDAREVDQLVEQCSTKIPDAEHQRIFDHNHAIALRKLKKFNEANALCSKIIEGYYALLDINPQDVFGKNPDVLWTIINRPENVRDHLKHLADALELCAIIHDEQGQPSPFARIHSMKFYAMAGAPESLVRVGQDFADEFVGRKDYPGARAVMEQHVLPVVTETGLITRLVQVRSQYAVILALCGEHDDAGAEMQRLEPYFEGLTGVQRQEFENQSYQIDQLAYNAARTTLRQSFGKVGRNEQCPCGSGLEFKKCHGDCLNSSLNARLAIGLLNLAVLTGQTNAYSLGS